MLISKAFSITKLHCFAMSLSCQNNLFNYVQAGAIFRFYPAIFIEFKMPDWRCIAVYVMHSMKHCFRQNIKIIHINIL
jgi:hypothetical protein